MKKITNIMMAVLLSTATITACAGNNTPETKKETVAKKESPVEIIYFHGKQRCIYNGWQFYINADVPVWHKIVGLQMVNSWALQTGIQYYL